MDISELKRQNKTARHPWEIERVNVLLYFINKYRIHNGHVIDIGGGDAYVIKSLHKKDIGNKHTAIDTAYTDDLVDQINNGDGTINFLKEIQPGIEKARCILLMDVLEHCEDDSELLTEAKGLATADTTFFITVPAYQALFSAHDVLLHHYRRYTAQQLTMLCKRNGFVVNESGYFFTSLLLVRCIQLFLEKTGLRKPEKTIDNWNGSNAVTKMICTFLKVDFYIGRAFSKLGIRLPGLSTFCICHPLP